MASKKRPSGSNQRPVRPNQRPARSSKSAAKSNPRLTNIQIAGIGIIVVVVAAIIFAVVSAQKPSAAAANPTTQATTSGSVPTPGAPKQYSAAPPMTIDQSKQYTATVKMAKGGEFTIQLFPDKAPNTVNSFVFLARQGFFDGTTFHRVLEGFMAQGGDPTGTGGGGPGYQFANENPTGTFDKAGVVAMANAGPNTNGSQFFITFGQAPLNGSDYTIFGQVTSGMDVVNAITRRDPQTNPTFTGDVMQSVTITEK
jgi:peptidylprolyl isomerase